MVDPVETGSVGGKFNCGSFGDTIGVDVSAEDGAEFGTFCLDVDEKALAVGCVD
jgi:hypothetical protein